MTISHVCTVGNGQFLQWDLMTKSTFCGVETKSMFIHTCGGAPKRSAKFGRQKRTFCGKKAEKAVSQIKSDRRLQEIS